MKPGSRSASLAALAIMAGAVSVILEKETTLSEALPGTIASPEALTPDIGSRERAAPASTEQYRQLAASFDRALVARDAAQRDTAFAHLLPALLRGAPSQLMTLFDRQPPGESRDAFRDELAREWIVHDRDAATAWIGTLGGEDRAAASVIAMRALTARSPAQALEFAKHFDLGWDDGSLEHLVQIWATEDPEAAANWIDTQPHDAWNDKLRARIEEVMRAPVSGV